jgi:hypothetical protein
VDAPERGKEYTQHMESRLTISRTSARDVKQRQVIVKLDGEEFATLMHGQSVTKEVPPGPHRLRVDNTWVWKTVEFHLAEGQHASFNVINRAGRLTWWMVGTLGAGPMYLTIEREAV